MQTAVYGQTLVAVAGQLRRRQPALQRDRRERGLGVRQRQRPALLRRGQQDARLRGRRAARLAHPAAGRHPDGVGLAAHQGRQGVRRADQARPGRRVAVEGVRRAGDRLLADRHRVRERLGRRQAGASRRPSPARWRSATRPTGRTRSTPSGAPAARWATSPTSRSSRASACWPRTEGLFAETAGGVTVATLKQLLERGQIDPDAETVLYNTGDGLKTLDVVAGGSVRPRRSRRRTAPSPAPASPDERRAGPHPDAGRRGRRRLLRQPRDLGDALRRGAGRRAGDARGADAVRGGGHRRRRRVRADGRPARRDPAAPRPRPGQRHRQPAQRPPGPHAGGQRRGRPRDLPQAAGRAARVRPGQPGAAGLGVVPPVAGDPRRRRGRGRRGRGGVRPARRGRDARPARRRVLGRRRRRARPRRGCAGPPSCPRTGCARPPRCSGRAPCCSSAATRSPSRASWPPAGSRPPPARG